MKNKNTQSLSANYAVVVPSFNRPKRLAKAMESIAMQTVLPNCVYLVIDEAIGDNDYSFLNNYSLDIKSKYTGGGCGGAVARNIGLEQIQNEDYVFFLDDDDEWCPKKIECQLKVLESDQSIIGITCWFYILSSKFASVKKVQRSNVKNLNNHLLIWNTIGSFSFFGYRLIPQTRDLRLNEDLAAAQDWEFYIRLAQIGQVSVAEKYLARYYEHEDLRITGNSGKKSAAWKMVYYKHRDSMSLRQRLMNRAKIDWKKSESSTGLVAKLGYSTVAIILSAVAMYGKYSSKVIVSSITSVVRGVRENK